MRLRLRPPPPVRLRLPPLLLERELALLALAGESALKSFERAMGIPPFGV